MPVWDGFVRLFHWSLVATLATAAASGFFGDATWVEVHLWSGIAAAALVALRVLWGFLGPTHARFGDFLAGPKAMRAHLRGLLSGGGVRHRGHNPLGGAMVLALLLVVALLAATGTIALGGVLKSGPLAFATSFATGWELRGLHRLLAFLLLGLIALHLAGVLVESRRSRENLVLALVDGRKEARAGDHPPAPRRARPVVAALLGGGLLAVSAAAVWSFAARPGLGVPSAPLDPTYAEECSACHVAYHPSLLPRASWATLMAGLDDHFGENASLDPETAAAIAAYLQANAAEAYDTKAANRLRRVAAERPFSITATPFWRRTHAGLPEALFASRPVGGRGNCEACHGDARSGRFDPTAIHVPEETTP
ncbi:cytochrome b/b6 domain-containing protein [Tistlia consotensis]|uniref:cytochrome b/b6 domain-containing protein n=1 Tax=Tistlia consotensis TaxID=1321365 RepID=UPI00190EC9E6|nr:cytochrome b/b6 domain-containing protein [Tistlia consotensis]